MTDSVQPVVPDWVLGALAPFLGSESEARWSTQSLVRWRFESRYFSSLIHFTLAAEDVADRRYVAKFPKALRGRGFSRLPHRSAEDLALAAKEYRAFEALSKTWLDGESEFVQPRFYDAPTGVLVFPFLHGEDLYTPSLVKELLRKRFPSAFVESMRILGRALALYHGRTEASGEFDVDKVIARLERAGQEFGVVIPGWVRVKWDRSAAVVPGIRGFEVRNARTAGDRIWLFDPGHLRQEPAEADVARFVVSLKMLTWGTAYFPMPLDTSAVERAFLNGYTEQRMLDESRLRLFLLREISWNWNEGRQVLTVKRLPRPVQYLVRKAYVNPGFRRLWGSV